MNFGRDIWETHDGLFEEIKLDAFSMLLHALVVEHNAERLEAVLTVEDRAEVITTTEVQFAAFYQEFGMVHPMPNHVMVMTNENDLLLRRLILAIITEIENDEAFEEYFEMFLEVFGNYLATTYAHYVLTDNREDAEQAHARFIAGEDALTIMQELSLSENTTERTSIWELPFTAAAEFSSLFLLSELEVSEIIEIDGHYAVIRIDEIFELDYDAVRADVLEIYVTELDLVQQLIALWFTSANMQKNNAAFNSLEISYIHSLIDG